MPPVEFDEGVDAVGAAPIVIEVEAAEERFRARVVGAERIAGSVHKVEAAVIAAAEALSDAKVRNQRQVAGVLQDMGGAGRNVEGQTGSGDGVAGFIAQEGQFGSEQDFGEARMRRDVGRAAARADGGEAKPVDDERDLLGDGDAADEGVIEVVATVPDGIRAGRVLPDEHGADFSERTRVQEEEWVGDRRGERLKARVALENLAIRAALEGAADAAADVVPAALELVSDVRPKAAEVGIVVDDAFVVGIGAADAAGR